MTTFRDSLGSWDHRSVLGTKETQKRILDTAIELFNEHGTASISANRIADVCGMSRGNLYYHFRNKQAIISVIYNQIAEEIRTEWVDDIKYPNVSHMLMMFDRQLSLIWRYRFFYRELMVLLAEDEALNARFRKDRYDRTMTIIEYFRALIDHGVLIGPKHPRTLENLVKLSWILSDNWINYTSVDESVYPACLRDGFVLLVDLFLPYLSESAQAALRQDGII